MRCIFAFLCGYFKQGNWQIEKVPAGIAYDFIWIADYRLDWDILSDTTAVP